MSMKLTSKQFENGGTIPDLYSREGGNVSPPLAWTGTPEAAKSLALIVDDPDAPSGTFVHWLVYAIPPDRSEFNQGESLSGQNGPRQGRNGFGDIGYGGPRPPSGTHRYFFHLYALDADVTLPEGASREQLDNSIKDHVIDQAELMGRYTHHQMAKRA